MDPCFPFSSSSSRPPGEQEVTGELQGLSFTFQVCETLVNFHQVLFFYWQASLLPGRKATCHINMLVETMSGQDTGRDG